MPRDRERSRSDLSLRARVGDRRVPWAWPLYLELAALPRPALLRAIEVLRCIIELLSRLQHSLDNPPDCEIEEEEIP